MFDSNDETFLESYSKGLSQQKIYFDVWNGSFSDFHFHDQKDLRKLLYTSLYRSALKLWLLKENTVS